MTFADDRPGTHAALEGHEVSLGLTREADEDEGRKVEAETPLVEERATASDDARFLKGADPAQARRRGNAGPAGEFDVGRAAVVLQLPQDLPVDGIETGFQPNLR